VLPVITASRVAGSLESAFALSVGLGLVSVLAGLTGSYYLDLAPGGAIVLLSAALFVVVLAYESVALRRA
jgi:zinc transport system permease protein